jgi:hypothetical protein
MKSQMKRILMVVLAAALLACVPGVALAGNRIQADMSEDMIISPMFTYINDADCDLSISANGVASMDASIECGPSVNKIRIVPNLQRYSGGSWQTVESWSQYYYSNTADWSRTYNVTSGYTYRLYVYFYAYNGSTLLESTTRSDTAAY